MPGESFVEAAHYKSDDALSDQPENHSLFWSDIVDNQGAKEGSRDIEGAAFVGGQYTEDKL